MSEVNIMLKIRKIGSILLVSLLIATTGGFSIYYHICSCLGNSSASIFYKATCEHENSREKSSCCSLVNMPSCCKEKPVPVSKTSIHKDHCCRNSSQFLKIHDSFQPGLLKINLKPLTIASTLLFFDIPTEDNILPSLNPFIADLPPPDSGRQIITAIHQLKIAPELV